MLAQWFNPMAPSWSNIRCKTEIYSDSGIMPEALFDATTSLKQEEYMSEIMTCPVTRRMNLDRGQLPVGKTVS